MDKEKNEEKIRGFDYHYTHGTSGGTQQFGRPRIVNEIPGLKVGSPPKTKVDGPATPDSIDVSYGDMPQPSLPSVSFNEEPIQVDASPPDIDAPEDFSAPRVDIGYTLERETYSKIKEYIKNSLKQLRYEKNNRMA